MSGAVMGDWPGDKETHAVLLAFVGDDSTIQQILDWSDDPEAWTPVLGNNAVIDWSLPALYDMPRLHQLRGHNRTAVNRAVRAMAKRNVRTALDPVIIRMWRPCTYEQDAA